MILPLLAALALSTPSDSTLTPVVLDASNVPLATPAAPGVAPTMPTAASEAKPLVVEPGPLIAGQWGLGFRALGSSYDILVRRALTSRTSIGLQVGWMGSRTEEHNDASSQSGYLDSGYPGSTSESGGWGDETVTQSGIRIEVPFEQLVGSIGSIQLSLALGPVVQFNLYDVESTSEPYQLTSNSFTGYYRANDYSNWQNRSFGGGLSGSMGVRWFFQPGFALAADFDASALWIHGWQTLEEISRSSSGYQNTGRTDSESDQVSTGSSFAGFGLEAWF